MKLKFYLRGLGVGILVTTLILTVSNNIKESKAAITDNTSTIASTLSTSRNETRSTEQTIEQTSEQTSEQQKETISETIESSIAQQNVTETNQTITVVLSNILNSERAAQAIENAGVIDDWVEFNDYLVNSGYATKIRNGTYTLYKGQDFESMANIITGK